MFTIVIDIFGRSYTLDLRAEYAMPGWPSEFRAFLRALGPEHVRYRPYLCDPCYLGY